jgi:hypothetical protein
MERINKIRQWLKQFNLKDIMLWFDTVASHPANQEYALRISFATAIALSIDQNEYEGRPFTRTKCINFFGRLNNSFGELGSLEDFIGFDQLSLIPIFWKHKKYYFYYGSFERPHEYLINFSKIYIGDNPNNALLENMFADSLTHQTTVLQTVSNLKESAHKCDKSYKVFVPSEYYFETIKDFFYATAEYPQTNVITQEVLSDLVKSGFEDYDIYNGYTIKISEEILHLPVTLHLQALYCWASNNIVANSTSSNVRSELFKYATNLLTVKSILDGVFDAESRLLCNVSTEWNS